MAVHDRARLKCEQIAKWSPASINKGSYGFVAAMMESCSYLLKHCLQSRANLTSSISTGLLSLVNIVLFIRPQ
jgi:hypothetical protein